MSSRRKKGDLEPIRDDHRLSEDDLSSLDAFCSETKLEEISYDEWCAHHSSLDLTVFLFITAEEADRGGTKQVRWSRTVWLEQAAARDQETREKMIRDVSFPSRVADGAKVVLSGLGDQRKGVAGNLNVIIRLK